MTYDPTQTLKNLQTALRNSGQFIDVLIGEPFSPPQSPQPESCTAALFWQTWEPAGTTLNTTIDIWTLLCRVYARPGMTPADAETVEVALAKSYGIIAATIAGGFTLGSTVRAVDWAGEEAGRKVGARWGHLVVAGTIFKVIDFTIPVIVDDSAVFVA